MRLPLLLFYAACVALACGPTEKELLAQKNAQLKIKFTECGYVVTDFKREIYPHPYSYLKLEGKGIEALVSQRDSSTIVYLTPYRFKQNDNMHSVIAQHIPSPNAAIVTAIEDINDITPYVYAGQVYKIPKNLAYLRDEKGQLTIQDCFLP